MRMNTKHFKPDEIIFREGEISHEAFFLVSGTVEISIESSGGPLVLGRLGAGEIFGEMGMITDRPRSATARALEAAVVESIGEAEFEQAILSRPDRLHTYLGTLFDRIRATDTLLQRELRKQQQVADRGLPPVAARRERAALKHRVRISSTEGNPHIVNTEIGKIPFRIGRAYADTNAAVFARNDLSVSDSSPYQVSRNHCEIDYGDKGLIVRDRGSTLGTVVNNTAIGADADALFHPLREGENLLLLGTESSPYRYLVTVENA
jgi:CRP/FNR family transcriptional regulator, cyclic AMP receptor protein